MKRIAKPKLQMLFRVNAAAKRISPCMPRDGGGQVRIADGKRFLSLKQAVRQPALIPKRWLIQALRLMYAHTYADLFDAAQLADAKKEGVP